MSENYASVTLELLSDKFFYSKTHICRLFLQNTGKSFNQTLIDIRISRANVLLKNTDLTVDEVSHMVGYESVEYFQRLYKRRSGITPGEYRKTRIGSFSK
jgi:2-isopropylmalate synthase